MGTALDDIAFLARSPNRFAVLEALATGSLDRRELMDDVGISRATLGRIFADLQERGWIEQADGRFRTTALGDIVATEFANTRETISTVEKLGAIAQWLPTDEFDFDLRRLGDARITVPTQSDPLAPVRRAVDRVRTADHVLLVTPATAPENLAVMVDRVESGTLSMDIVMSRTLLETVSANDTMRVEFARLFDSERTTVYRYDGEISFIVAVVDDTVDIAISDDEGIPRALIESDDESVHAWATERFDSYRRRSEAISDDDWGMD